MPVRMMLISPWIDVTVSDPASQTINDQVLSASEAQAHGLRWAGDLDLADPRGVGCSCGAEIVGLVVSIVPAGAEVHHWRIDTMWRRSFTQRASRHVVCFVVFIVVARGDVWVLSAEVASGPVLFHVEPPSIGARLVAERSPQLIIRATED
jgi:hypothetical protein